VYKKQWEKALTKKLQTGTPRLIYLCSSAIRCVDVIRTMRSLGPKVKIGKLFAKHLKLQDQLDFLKKNKISAAVGTPNRVLKLIQEGALNLDGLDFVLLDTSHKDKKEMHIFDLPEVAQEIKALFESGLKPGTKVIGF
jgi:protein CMS1